MKKVPLLLLGLVMLVFIGGLTLASSTRFGARSSGARLERIRQSPHWRDGRFVNVVATPMSPSTRAMLGSMVDFLRGGDERVPTMPIPVRRVDAASLQTLPPDDLAVTWLGHSSVLLRVDGRTLLTDPVFGKRASPFSFTGPRRFFDDLPLGLDDLPPIDAVVISHDHFDHLEQATIAALATRAGRFFVPLGVGAHLEAWDVPGDRITELDWGQEAALGDLVLAATPARHFSGRGLNDRYQTLWASWVIRGPVHRVFFGGDSGYFGGFEEIGDRYGPFDIALVESGAYNEAWPNIHMMPEQAVQACLDLKGRVLMPIHWATFNLSTHSWTEPVERLLREAAERELVVATPRPGETFRPAGDLPRDRWWRLEASDRVATP